MDLAMSQASSRLATSVTPRNTASIAPDQRFGLLTAVEPAGFIVTGRQRVSAWRFRCDCGRDVVRSQAEVKAGSRKSCGCQRGGAPRGSGNGSYKHGKTRAPEYRCWIEMRRRCCNPDHHAWAQYGGTGITVCERWRSSFEEFLADVGPRPSPVHSLDRWPNKFGNYEPGNVRWATPQEQQQNRRDQS